MTAPSFAAAISNSTYLKWGLLGGFVGGTLMALAMIGAVNSVMGDGVAVVCSMGVALIGLQPTSTVTTTLGIALHLVMSVVVGAILVVISSLLIKRWLRITKPSRGLAVGLLAGVLVFLILGLPIMFYVMVPAMVDVLGMMAPTGTSSSKAMEESMMMIQSAMVPLIGAWLAAHLIYGGVWGTIVGYGASRSASVAANSTPAG